MPKKRFRQQLDDFVKVTQPFAWWFQLLPVLLQASMFIISLVFPRTAGLLMIMLMLLVFVVDMVAYSLYAAGFDDADKPKRLIWAKISGLIVFEYAVLTPFLYLTHRFGTYKIMFAALLFFALPMILVYVMASNSETGKKIWAAIGSIAVQPSEESTKEDGDLVLCVDKEIDENQKASGIPFLSKQFLEEKAKVIIPYKDRFLHMLILGPTGAGKTSQVLLPMIRQDLQNSKAGVIVMDPKGDLARSTYFMSLFYGRPAKLFDPELDNCLRFNPLAGREDRVVANMQKTFTIMMADSSDYFQNMTSQCVGNTAYLLKRLDRFYGQPGKYATLLNMSAIIQDIGDEGRSLVNEFAKLKENPNFAMDNNERRQNNEIVAYFTQKYFVERSKEFEACTGLRSQLSSLCSNEYLRNVLNPDISKGEKNDIDFDKALEDGEVLCISTAQGLLGQMSGFIGYFLTLQLQASVLRRPGNEDTRRPCFLYIDEFQTYANMGFADMLTQGRSYRVAVHLATQARAQIGMNAGRDGKTFTDLVSTNARSVVIFPGLSPDDALYYSKKFGEYEKEEVEVNITRKKFSLLSGGFDKLGHPSENIRHTKKMVANFTPTDITYQRFGEIVFSIVQEGTLRPARVGKIRYIPSDLKKYLDNNINSYVAEHRKLSADEAFENKKAHDVNSFVMEDGTLNDDGSFTPVERTQPKPSGVPAGSGIQFDFSQESPPYDDNDSGTYNVNDDLFAQEV